MTERRLERAEVIRMLELDEGFLVELEQEAIVSPDAEGRFSEEAVERIRISRTLAVDLGVNLPGIDVALGLMERIRSERRQFEETLVWLHHVLDQPG